MNTRYTTVNLDVSQQGSIPSITLSQYDRGVGLSFYIMDGGLPYSEFAETDTVVLSGTKPSGVGFTVPAYYKSGNLCSFRTPQAMTTEAGTVTCEITITKVNNISVSTANFFVEVEASAHAHETVDEDIEDFSLIANQVGEYKAVAVRAAQQAAQSATDASASADSAEESMEAAQSAASSAIAAKDDIQEYIDDSEAWALGTRGGVAVPSTDGAYHNNSKYYAEKSGQDAEAWAKGTRGGTAVPSTDETYENNAKYYAEQSSQASMDAEVSATEAAASAQEAAATLAGAVKPAAIDAEFSTSTAYAVGDTVVYQGRLYEFTSAHAAGAWNASHVQAISVMDEVSDLKGDLNKISVGTSSYELMTLVSGGYISLTGTTADIDNPVSDANYYYGVLNCSEGDRFIVFSNVDAKSRAYGFVDKDGRILFVSGANQTFWNTFVTAPASAEKLIINTLKINVFPYKFSNQSVDTGEILYTLSSKDDDGYFVSQFNIFKQNHYHMLSVEPSTNYKFKKFRVQKGDVVEASGGYHVGIDILALVDEYDQYIETIASGECRNYKYIVRQDGYVIFSSKVTDENYNHTIRIYRASERDVFDFRNKDVEDVWDYGWKKGYIAADTHEYKDLSDSTYVITNPIYVPANSMVRVEVAGSDACLVLYEKSVYDDKYTARKGAAVNSKQDYKIFAQFPTYLYVSHNVNAGKPQITIEYTNDTVLAQNPISDTDSTSLNEFIYPWMGIIATSNIIDRPHGLNGNLLVLAHNIDYVFQQYYIYSRGILLHRLLKRDGTPYNSWKAQGIPLYDKTIVGIGDSLMRGNTLNIDYTWIKLLESDYLAYTYNYGINGNTVAVQTKETTNPPMVNRINTIHNEHADVDYFVLIGGANDFRLDVPIGEDDSNNKNEFCGALNSIIDQVRTYWPKVHMLFMTNYDRRPDATNTLGLMEVDYVEAMKRVCAKKHVFCFDNYHDSGVAFSDSHFSAWADEGIYNGGSANKHFSPEGYKWLLPKYKALLEMV